MRDTMKVMFVCLEPNIDGGQQRKPSINSDNWNLIIGSCYPLCSDLIK